MDILNGFLSVVVILAGIMFLARLIGPLLPGGFSGPC